MAAPNDPAMTPEVLRKLSTILSADVAGYSRLMAEDEEATLITFRAHSAVFDALVAQHRGRVFNRAGDAILAEFDSVVEAVRCATDIQSALQTRNSPLPENRRVRFRIGINLGDVLIQGEDLLGDGVNVAARLQTAAAPGGICLSGSVYDQIRNKLTLAIKPMGEMSFKNIPQPIRTFSITGSDGENALPTPQRARPGRAVAGVAAVVIVLLAGGGFWFWSQQPKATPVATATTSAASSVADASQDGIYAGPICYGPSPNEGARCFRQQATLSSGRLTGQWVGREPGSTVYLTGIVSAAGDTQINLLGKKADGTPFFHLDFAGKLANGTIAATGTFFNGRSAKLDWAKAN